MKKQIIFLVCLLFSLQLFSATDGALGPTSTGTSDLSVSITTLANPDPEISITGMEDYFWNVIDVSAGDTIVLSSQTISNICVYITDTLNFYYLSLSSLNGGLSDLSSGNYTPYTIEYIDGSGQSETTNTDAIITGGGGLSTAFIADNSSGCIGGSFSSLTIMPESFELTADNNISEEILLYDQLTLTVTPL